MSKGTSQEEKIENIRNMKAMIEDYKKIHKRTPTNAEFGKALGMAQRTAQDYRNIIQEENRQQLLELFQNDLIPTAEELIKTIDENIVIFKSIRDDSGKNAAIRMEAAKNMEESYLDQLRIKRDGPEFLTGKYESNLGSIVSDETSDIVTTKLKDSDSNISS